MVYRGRMPVFYYLSPQEAADAYLYLSYYPPTEKAKETPAIALSEGSSTSPGEGGPAGGDLNQPGSHEEVQANGGMTQAVVILLASLSCLVFGLLATGLAFTVREFGRMSPKSKQAGLPPRSSPDSERQQTTSVSRAALGRYRVSKPAHTISHG
jgi:hypothetical protein